MEKRIRFTIILVLILIVVIAFSFQSKEKKEYLVYNEALDKTAVTVDDVSLTLKDIAFYVAYEEKTVQEQAILYNPDNPRQYWNVYTDGQFVKLTAKQAALDMAVHDEIFYQMAVAEGVKLDVTEQEYLENDESDFWSDLEDWQREQLGISEEELDSEMEKIALADKYDTSDAITLNETGELTQLMGNHLYEYTQLSIAGTLNGEDLSCMRMMMGRDNNNASTPGKLSDIDLTDVHLAADGMVGPYHHEAAENQIVQGTFAGCEKLTHVVLPADATTIGKDAFADCTSLREIEIPASAGSILPSSGCTALEALTVSPANANYKSQDGVLLNAEGNRIVWFPMGKKGKYTLPSAFTSIGAYAFKECSIEAFYLSDNVKTLGQGAFMDSQIKEIHLGAGIKLIPTGVFQGCRKLTKVYLGANTEQISNYAFDGSPLTDLYVSASMIPYCEENAFANKVEGFFATCVLHVPAGMKKSYQNHKIWGKFTHIVEE